MKLFFLLACLTCLLDAVVHLSIFYKSNCKKQLINLEIGIFGKLSVIEFASKKIQHLFGIQVNSMGKGSIRLMIIIICHA